MLYFVVFITNASILIFEIAGARLLAPYLGTSVEVWAGTIAVILGGMAVGYWIAGIIADKHSSRSILAWLILGSALAALLAWGTRDLIPTMFASGQGLPLTFMAMLTATFLFMPTTILLAAVSPFVAKALIVGLDSSARVVGRLNAVGTVGSIAGAIATSTLLIPHFGLDLIMLGIAIVLFALSLALATTDLVRKTLVIFVVGAAAIGAAQMPVASDLAIADVSTLYNRIWVSEFEYDGSVVRAVQTDPFGIQCGMRIEEDGSLNVTEVTFPYLRAFELVSRELLSSAPKALFLGGCNYSYPRAFLHAREGATAMVVEIDPGMTQVAEDYFAFDPEANPDLTFAHADARRFLAQDENRYDVIFLDVFGSSTNVPHHLTTKETFALMRDRLALSGVLVANVVASYGEENNEFVSALYHTAKISFPYLAFYSIGTGNQDRPQNLILVASPYPLEFSNIVYDPSYPQVALRRVDASSFSDHLVLTDDYAPVEYLSRKMYGGGL